MDDGAAGMGGIKISGCHGYILEEYIHASYPYPLFDTRRERMF